MLTSAIWLTGAFLYVTCIGLLHNRISDLWCFSGLFFSSSIAMGVVCTRIRVNICSNSNWKNFNLRYGSEDGRIRHRSSQNCVRINDPDLISSAYIWNKTQSIHKKLKQSSKHLTNKDTHMYFYNWKSPNCLIIIDNEKAAHIPFINIHSTGWGVNTCVALVWRDTPPSPVSRREADVTQPAKEWTAFVIKIHEENRGEEDWQRGSSRGSAGTRSVSPRSTATVALFKRKNKQQQHRLGHTSVESYAELLRFVRLSSFFFFFEQTRGDNCTVSQPSGLEWKSAIFCLTTPGSRATGK